MKRYLVLATLLFAPLFMVPASVSAVDVFQRDVCDESAAKNATVCKDSDLREDKTDPDSDQQNPLFGKGGILTTAIGILSVIVAIVSVIVIMLAGLKFISSGSNPQDVSVAREQVIYACVGLVVAGLAQAMVRFILDKV